MNYTWLIIIDFLEQKGLLRSLVNLLKALKIKKNIKKFLLKELYKSRFPPLNSDYYLITKEKDHYNKLMIYLWEKTGIDDGVPPLYLVLNLNKNTRLYRTIFSHDIYKNNKGKNVILDKCKYDLIEVIENNPHYFKEKYINSMIKDRRVKPDDLFSWHASLTEKSQKLIKNNAVNYKKNKTLINFTHS